MASDPSLKPEQRQHTPGPWVADDGDGEYFGVFAKETGEAIALLVEPGRSYHDVPLPRDEDFVKASRGEGQGELVYRRYDEHKANATLIAAAPDLLAALKRAENFIAANEHLFPHLEASPTYHEIVAAIAKAEGR